MMKQSLKEFLLSDVYTEFESEFIRRVNFEWSELPNLDGIEADKRALVWAARLDGLKRAREILKEMANEGLKTSPLQKAMEAISEIKY